MIARLRHHLAHTRRLIRAHRYLYVRTSRSHGHKHRSGALVCAWCINDVLFWAPRLAAYWEGTR